jgi:hypothetical protein
MKKLFLLKAALALAAALSPLAAPFAAAAESDEDSLNEAVDKVIGHWKRNFAAPAYGLALFSVDIKSGGLPGVSSSLGDDTFLAPAVDLRIFRGVNVSKRGGFYTGLETGVFIFLPFSHSFTDVNVSVDETGVDTGGTLHSLGSLNFKVRPYGGVVFLMAKYGLRMDVGTSKAGFGAGLELGAGGSIYAGGFDLWMGPKDNPLYEAAGTSDTTKMSLLLDASAEWAFRVGRNFRMFAKGSVIITPVVFERRAFPIIVGNGVNDTDLNVLTTYALNNYDLEFHSFVYDLRAGFIVNFD